MGCDIHCYLEKRVFSYSDKEKKNPVWVNADTWKRDAYFDMEKTLNPDKTKEELEEEFGTIDSIMQGWEIPYDDRIYSGRNYDLFAILANVRNGFGFAGIPTGEGFVPIDMPRGLPEDVSAIVKAISDAWDCDGHSHSFLTLRELLDYDWEGQSTVTYGTVGEKEYEGYKENGMPPSWCGAMMGRNILNVDHETMDKIISGEMEREKVMVGEEEMEASYVTKVKWNVTYADSCRWFLNNTIPKLKAMCEEFAEKDEDGRPKNRQGIIAETADDLRLVFFFDN